MEQVPEIFQSDRTKTIGYLRELLKGKQSVRKKTIMIVGEQGVGKTSFIKQLIGSKWVGNLIKGYDRYSTLPITKNEKIKLNNNNSLLDIKNFEKEVNNNNKNNNNNNNNNSKDSQNQDNNNEKSLKGVGIMKSIYFHRGNSIAEDENNNVNEEKVRYRYNITDGIDINQWTPNNSDIVFTIFDFAGQEIYYNTHQFFFTKDSIFIVMFDGSEDLHKNRIVYWLHTIMMISPSSTIFLVSTHMDLKISSQKIQTNNFELEKLINQFNFLLEEKNRLKIISPVNEDEKKIFWSISTTKVKKFPIIPLVDRIIEEAEKQVQSTVFPKSWMKFRSILFPHLMKHVKHDYRIKKEKRSNSDHQIDDGKWRQRSRSFNDEESDRQRNVELNTDDHHHREIKKLYSELENINQGEYISKMIDDRLHNPSCLPILEWNELLLISRYCNLKENETNLVMDLISSWGEVIIIRNMKKNINIEFVVLKPQWLISIFKCIISMRYFGSGGGDSPLTKTNSFYRFKKRLFKDKTNNIDNSIVSITQIYKRWEEEFKEVKINDTKQKVAKIIKILVEIRLILPLDEEFFLIPSLLPQSTPHFVGKLLQLFHQPISDIVSIDEFYHFHSNNSNNNLNNINSSNNNIKNSGVNNNSGNVNNNKIIKIERRYELKFVPEGLFNRILSEIWKWKKLEKYKIWANGFVISDLKSTFSSNEFLLSINNSNNSYNNSPSSPMTPHSSPALSSSTSPLLSSYPFDQSFAIINLEKDKFSLSTAIIVSIQTDRYSFLREILPTIHRSILNIVQSLELENSLSIICSFISTENFVYSYNDCLTTALDNFNQFIPPKLLPFLIPEFYRSFKSRSQDLDLDKEYLVYDEDEGRYQREVTELQLLGQGSSGEVFAGKWYNQFVAIKKPVCQGHFEITSLINEIDFLRELKHKNLLRLYDIYQKPFAIITELCNEGDLEKIINLSDNFPSIIALAIMRDLTSAIHYLHSRSPPIIHCDVRLPNVFIKNLSYEAEVCAVLGDVGYARFADELNQRGKRSVDDDLAGLFSINNHLITKISSQLMESSNSYEIDVRVILHLRNFSELFNENTKCNCNLEEISGDMQKMINLLIDNDKFQDLIFFDENSSDCLDFIINLCRTCKYDYETLKSHNNTEKVIEKLFDVLRKLKNDFPLSWTWRSICQSIYPIIHFVIKSKYVKLNDFIIDLYSLRFVDVGDKRYNRRLIHFAAHYGNQILLEQTFKLWKCNPNVRIISSNQTALHLAAERNSPLCINTLYECGSDLNLCDGHGKSALYISAELAHFSSLVTLLNLNADPNVFSDHKRTPILVAAQGYLIDTNPEYLKSVNALLQFGSVPNALLDIEEKELQVIQERASVLISECHIYSRSSQTLLHWLKWSNL